MWSFVVLFWLCVCVCDLFLFDCGLRAVVGAHTPEDFFSPRTRTKGGSTSYGDPTIFKMRSDE